MPLIPSRELVLKKLRDCFRDPQTASEALDLLDTYGTESWHAERERVQLAVLKQCEGNLERLLELVVLAGRDYRDVLVGAEFHEEWVAPPGTPAAEMAAIRKRDREQYETWLRAGGPGSL
jgi:hypothetical protein